MLDIEGWTVHDSMWYDLDDACLHIRHAQNYLDEGCNEDACAQLDTAQQIIEVVMRELDYHREDKGEYHG